MTEIHSNYSNPVISGAVRGQKHHREVCTCSYINLIYLWIILHLLKVVHSNKLLKSIIKTNTPSRSDIYQTQFSSLIYLILNQNINRFSLRFNGYFLIVVSINFRSASLTNAPTPALSLTCFFCLSMSIVQHHWILSYETGCHIGPRRISCT